MVVTRFRLVLLFVVASVNTLGLSGDLLSMLTLNPLVQVSSYGARYLEFSAHFI